MTFQPENMRKVTTDKREAVVHLNPKATNQNMYMCLWCSEDVDRWLLNRHADPATPPTDVQLASATIPPAMKGKLLAWWHWQEWPLAIIFVKI